MIRQYPGKLGDYFVLCKNLNKLGQNVMTGISIYKHLPEIVLGCLLARAMGNFQAVILLSERGMMPQTKAMLRCLIEVMFEIVAISNDKNYAVELVKTNGIEDKKAINTCIRNAKYFTKEEVEKLKNKMEELKSQTTDVGAYEITKRDVATKAGLEEYYDFAYKMLSRSLHVDLKTLGNEHLLLDGTGKLKGVKWGPNLKEMEMVLLTACDAIFRIFDGVFNAFEIEDKYKKRWSSTFDKLKYTYHKLSEKVPQG